MKFQNILIVYSEKESFKHVNCFLKIQDYFKGFSKSVNFVSVKKINRQIIEGNDLVIIVGGDGAFIRVSHYVKDELILGINSEKDHSEGALTELDENNIERLNELLEGNFKINEKDRIELKINGRKINELALNEVYVGAITQFHTSRYKINFQGKEEEHRSSGVLFSTSTGSGAWYKSAGGKKFDENKIKFIVREPFFSRLFNPTLVEGEFNGGEKIEIVSTMRKGGACVLDSNKVIKLEYEDEVELNLSKYKLKTIELN